MIRGAAPPRPERDDGRTPDRHEIMHVAATVAWGVPAAPREWLNEGLATYAPGEMLNRDVKSNALGRKRPTTLGDLMQSVRGYLRSRQRTPGIVRRYFLEPHIHYAAA